MTNEARITPHHTIRHYTRHRAISVEEIGVAPYVVACWSRSTLLSLAESTGAERSKNWMYGDRNLLFTGHLGRREVSFIQMPVGAPGTITIMEEMIACGAHTFLGFGLAGGLQPNAGIGSLVTPTTCIRQEGTSTHYLPPGVEVGPHHQLVAALSAAAQKLNMTLTPAPHWTTDAPYREMVAQIDTFRKQGVYSVDMETSAMYALGQFRGVRVANLLVISDEVWRAWRPGFRTAELEHAVTEAQNIVLTSLNTIPPL